MNQTKRRCTEIKNRWTVSGENEIVAYIVYE